MLKVYLVLLIALYSNLYLFSWAQRRPPREYGIEYPETRKINVSIIRPTVKPFTDSFVENEDKNSQHIPQSPTSRVGNTHLVSDSRDKSSRDRILFTESESIEKELTETTRETSVRRLKGNKKHRNKNLKNNLKRIQRQTEDYEPEECAKCLDEKYLKHYYAKGCKPIDVDSICKNSCPKYFECPEVETKPSLEGCEYKGITYKIDDMIPVDNECTHCRCVNQSGPAITCAVSECFGDWKPLNQSCYRHYDSGNCCARIVCIADEELGTVKTCLYKDKTYKIGEKIYPKEDNCVSCICTENWNQTNPINSPNCKRHDCDFELQTKWQNRQNCIPIYHENTCCPIDYHCPTPKERKCLFDGKQYEIGDKLVVKSNCVDCECRVPPDFTCIHRKCDPKPNETNCTPIYETNQCCPTYNCSDDSLKLNKRKNKLLTDLETSTESKAEENVTMSSCPPYIPGGLFCAGTNCTTIIGSDGCQTCSCETPCPQLQCIHPCYLFAITPGQCPQCSCP